MLARPRGPASVSALFSPPYKPIVSAPPAAVETVAPLARSIEIVPAFGLASAANSDRVRICPGPSQNEGGVDSQIASTGWSPIVRQQCGMLALK